MRQSMSKKEFEQIVADVGLSAVPKKFRHKIKNVAFIVEDRPSNTIRLEEGLQEGETLLGLYQGIPATERGDHYGIGMVLPDTITLYRKPIEEKGSGDKESIKKIIVETIWHEVAHHFGLDHDTIESRERRI